MQGGVGVDEGVQRLVAFAVALGLPGADGAALLEAGDDAFGGQLAEVVGIEAAGEVDGAGAGFGQFQAGVDGVLHRVHADDEEWDLALVRARRTARPDGDAGPAAALDRPDAAGEAVRELQRKLGLTVDGQFGPLTRSAVITFQHGRQLLPDGVVGPMTWAAIFG
mgnify:CR=1 FL=1